MEMKKIISILLAVMILTSMTTVAMAAKKQTKSAAFTGELLVEGPKAKMKPGAMIELKAKVKNANLSYSVKWQLYNAEEEKWEDVGEGKKYKFSAPEEGGTFVYRAFLKAKDGTTLKKKIKVIVKIFGRKTLLELNFAQVTKE